MGLRRTLIAARAVIAACAVFATCTALAGIADAPLGAGTTSPATVTARPPLEAVPATPDARAQQLRLRSCTTAARAKHLHGKARVAFVKACMTPRQAAPALPSNPPATAPSPPPKPPRPPPAQASR